MNRFAAILVAVLVASASLAIEPYLILAAPRATWTALANGKQAKIRTFLRTAIRDGADFDTVEWYTSNNVPVIVACFATAHLRADLTREQIEAAKDELNDANIRYALSSDPWATLRAAGLKPEAQ